jgi:hypothetical protein
VHFLNRLVLDDDALGHKHVDAITDLDFDLAVLTGKATSQPTSMPRQRSSCARHA